MIYELSPPGRRRLRPSVVAIPGPLPSADVRRGDGDDLRVKSTIMPSDPVYLRADCEQIQSEGRTP